MLLDMDIGIMALGDMHPTMLHARFPGARSTAPAYRALCSRGYAVGWGTTYDIAVSVRSLRGD